MNKILKIGTRESQLAVWQADTVRQLLQQLGIAAELVHIKSEGDTDLITPLYEIGIQGIFTKALDMALLNSEIDIAVHSMKDVPTQLAKGIVQVAVLPRASYKDLLIPRNDISFLDHSEVPHIIATSSIRRKAQWLNRYPKAQLENLRGNVNTRLRKVAESNWQGAIFAAAGLERIGLRPENAVELDWMLPAPAQGAITIVCRADDEHTIRSIAPLNHENTELCTRIERDFLNALSGGCATPIGALASIAGGEVCFEGNILSVDGQRKAEIKKTVAISKDTDLGKIAALELLANGGQEISDEVRNGK